MVVYCQSDFFWNKKHSVLYVSSAPQATQRRCSCSLNAIPLPVSVFAWEFCTFALSKSLFRQEHKNPFIQRNDFHYMLFIKTRSFEEVVRKFTQAQESARAREGSMCLTLVEDNVLILPCQTDSTHWIPQNIAHIQRHTLAVQIFQAFPS